jgi:hypothetical protein
MKKWLKNITGITAKEQELEATELEVIKKKDPKAYATRKKLPWVNVLDMQVNEQNIRNGFFELDWNKYFIQELIANDYGTEADKDEDIVDRWFRDIVYNMLAEEGMDTNRDSGMINIVPLDKGKSEVS